MSNMKFKLNLVIYSLIVCLLVKQSFADNSVNDTKLYKCVTSDGNPGICLVKELCNHWNGNQLSDNNCSDDSNTICCPEFSVKKVHPFWESINNLFWNNIANLTNTSVSNDSTPLFGSTSTPTPSVWTPVGQTNPVCGARNLKKDYGFIVGGNEAPAHSWPWAVAVYTGSGSSFHNYKFVCGASVISERYVLGAAHCVSHNSRVAKPETIRLLIGAHDRRYEGVYHRVQRVFVHKLYDERLMQNDIALYKLAEPINFNKTSNIAPVCLPDSHWHQRDYTNQMVQLVGWGTTSAGGRTSDILRQVQVPIITNKDCARSYNALMVTSKQMCAGYAAGKRDSCQGDSGGPMTMQLDGREGRYVQIGITSWGKGCAEPKYPGVYTKVSYYIDWIQSNTNNVND